MEVSGGAEKEKYREIVFKETMTINFPNMGKKLNLQIYEVQKPPDRIERIPTNTL